MPGRSPQSEWPRIVAAVAVRLQVSPNEVRSMYWVDFREVLKLFGVKVKKTPAELEAEIMRLLNG